MSGGQGARRGRSWWCRRSVQGGGVFNAAGASLMIIGTSLTLNIAIGGAAARGTREGRVTAGPGAPMPGWPASGGDGAGGAGGSGGAAGYAEGGGLCNSGIAILSGSLDTFSTNGALGGSGGAGGGGGSGDAGVGGLGNSNSGGYGGIGTGGAGGKGGVGGLAAGGGIANDSGGRSRVSRQRPSRRTRPLAVPEVPAAVVAPATVGPVVGAGSTA